MQPGDSSATLEPDSYFTPINTELNVEDPGVLTNDTLTGFEDVSLDEGPSHDAYFYFDPSYGRELKTNEGEGDNGGGFYYCPQSGFVGVDHFTYEVCSYDESTTTNYARPEDEVSPCQTETVTILVGGGGCSSGFADVPASNPFCVDIAYLTSFGFAQGYPDGNFHPTAAVTRGAAAAILQRFAGPSTLPACTKAPFSDVPKSNPFCPSITYLVAHKVIAGNSDGTFHPSAAVSRQAAAALLYRLENPGKTAAACTKAPFSDVPASNPFCGDITWLVANGIADGSADGTFHPARAVLRQEIASFVHRLGNGGN